LNARAVANGRLQSSRYPTQQRLIAAIRRGEEPAMQELFVLYAPLLRDQAKRMSVPIGERDQLVDTVLDDVVLHLVDVTIPPRELTTYVVGALRNRVRSVHRDSERARSNDEGRYAEYGDSDQKIIAECHSEYGLRTARPLDADSESPLRSAIKKLGEKSASALSSDELILMVGVSHEIPVRELAEQLGLSYVAARVKISRLRERFIRLAIQYVETLAAAERQEVERFFRRADIRLTTAEKNSRSKKERP
jgi:hypothetical protein